MTFTDLFDQYFEWWQGAAVRYLKVLQHHPFFFKGVEQTLIGYLDAKRAADRVLEETWRQLHLPPLEEVIRIHERLNRLESLWASRREAESGNRS